MAAPLPRFGCFLGLSLLLPRFQHAAAAVLRAAVAREYHIHIGRIIIEKAHHYDMKAVVATNYLEVFDFINRFTPVAITLDEAVASGKIQRGDLILLVVFGAGLTWASPFGALTVD